VERSDDPGGTGFLGAYTMAALVHAPALMRLEPSLANAARAVAIAGVEPRDQRRLAQFAGKKPNVLRRTDEALLSGVGDLPADHGIA
jgi:hypothetical protein